MRQVLLMPPMLLAIASNAFSAVVFYEDFGTTAPLPQVLHISEYSGLSSGLAFGGNSALAETPVPSSRSSGYPGASGGSAVGLYSTLSAEETTLFVRGIDTTPFQQGTFRLSFGYALGISGVGVDPAAIQILATTDDVDFLLLDTFQPQDVGIWQFYESVDLSLPRSSDLTLYFEGNLIFNNNLDDMRLEATAVPEPSNGFFLICVASSAVVKRRRRFVKMDRRTIRSTRSTA